MLAATRLSLTAATAARPVASFPLPAASAAAVTVISRGKATATATEQPNPATTRQYPKIKPTIFHKNIPGPKSYPFIGALPTFTKLNGAKRIDEFNRKMFLEYGPVSKLELFGNSTVLLFDPEDCRRLYADIGKYPSSPVDGMPALKKQLEVCNRANINLAALEYEEWKRLRTNLQKFIMPPQQAISYLPVINPISADYSASLASSSVNQKTLKETLPRYTFEVIGAVLFGKRMGALDGSNQSNEKFINNALNLFYEGASFTFEFPWYQYFNTPKFQKFVDNNEYIFNEGRKEVLEVMEKLKVEPEKYANTYVGRLLLAHDLNIEEIAENCGGLFAAGVDTTSNTIAWLLLHMAQFPEVQEKLAQELRSVLKGGDYNEALSSQLPYMKACFKESVRMDPVAPMVPRRLQFDFTTKTGHTLQAGTEIMIACSAMFRDARFVEKPEEFIPERWSEEAKAKRAQEGNHLDLAMSFFPFSFGARMCLGARLAGVEMNSLIARLVQDYKISLPPNHGPIDKVAQPFLQPFPFPTLVFTPRK